MSTQVNLYEAKAKLSDLVERAVNGEDIVIARAGRPRVRLVAVVEQTAPRQPGRWKNQPVVLVAGWDDDLTEEFEDL